MANVTFQTDPFVQFDQWYQEAKKCERISEPHAMSVSTCSKDGKPSSRIVFMEECTKQGFVFYSNYESRKGQELKANANACLLFYWPPLRYQVRVEGIIEKLSTEESKKYFESRPKGIQVSACICKQSEELSSRAELDARFQEFMKEHSDKSIDKPDYWGGYVLLPTRFEFWQGGSNRLHDRVEFTKNKDQTSWNAKRLYP